jgi:hypothetical protein
MTLVAQWQGSLRSTVKSATVSLRYSYFLCFVLRLLQRIVIFIKVKCLVSFLLAYFHSKWKQACKIAILRACQSFSLITSEPTGGFSFNLVGTWSHERWPRSHIFNTVTSTIPKLRSFKLLRWVQENPRITSEPTGEFGWHFVWRQWHWRWPR